MAHAKRKRKFTSRVWQKEMGERERSRESPRAYPHLQGLLMLCNIV